MIISGALSKRLGTTYRDRECDVEALEGAWF